MTTDELSLQAQDLACHRAQHLVFKGVSFSLTAGGTLFLTGDNGSGKSSLLRIIAGLLPQTSGTIAWTPSRVALTYFGSKLDANPRLTVAQHLVLWQGLFDSKRPQKEEYQASILSYFGLDNLQKRRVGTLSLGQKQKLKLSRLFFAPPGVWILDEPFVGLDEETCARVTELLLKNAEQGGLNLVASHISFFIPKTKAFHLGGGETNVAF